MNEEARKQFEATLQSKGKRASGWNGERYDNSNIQTYWRWFFLGFTVPCTKDEARQQFESILHSKGKSSPKWNGSRYININIQTYWRWFLLGCTMRGGK